MQGCLFCRIVRKELPASVVYEDDGVLAFRDIQPQAPLHLLLIPKRHIRNVDALGPGDGAVVARLFEVARDLAREHGVADGGYRLVTNVNEGAGQSVWHLHFHLLGGRPLGWPPG
jgi:histidine triad (HIT) family protein